MLRQCRYTYPDNGKVFICADGPEILVYSASNDGPLWKFFGNDLVIGTGVTREEVFSLEASGLLRKMRLVNGEYLDEDQLNLRPAGLLISADDVIAVIGEQRLFVRHPGIEPMEVAISSVSAVGFGPTGGALGLGTETGIFHAIDTTTGGAWGTLELGGPVMGVCWSAQEFWLVGVGHHIHTISGDGQQILESLDVGGNIQALTCSQDGAIVVALTNDTHVRIFEWLNKSLAGNIWFQRTVQSVQFGPSSWLLLAHEEGEANRVDLFTGQMTRTLAHEGRGQNAWPMQVEVNHALLRGTSTTIKAGAAPIAVQVRSQSNEEKRSGSLKWLVLAVLFGFIVCSTIGAIFCGLGPLIRGPKYHLGF